MLLYRQGLGHLVQISGDTGAEGRTSLGHSTGGRERAAPEEVEGLCGERRARGRKGDIRVATVSILIIIGGLGSHQGYPAR